MEYNQKEKHPTEQKLKINSEQKSNDVLWNGFDSQNT